MRQYDTFQSMVICPACGTSKIMRISTEWQRRFWTCPGCRELRQVRDDECCIFCRYGDAPCAQGRLRAAKAITRT